MIEAGPDLIVPGTTNPKYWNLAIAHLGAGKLALDLSGDFPGGSDYNIPASEAAVSQEYPLMLGVHVEICQLKTDSAGNILNNCRGTCQAPPTGICPTGTGFSGGNCYPRVAPAGLKVTPQGNFNNVVDISWAPVPGATAYRVYWGPGAAGGTLNPFSATTTATAVTDARDWGSTYHYAVTALIGGVQSGYSASVPVTFFPAAPAGVTGVGGVGQVTLSWNAVNGATRYQVYRFDGANYVWVASPSGTTLSVTGLASEAVYSYAVDAWNAAGASARSATMTVRTLFQCSAATCPTGCCSSNLCQPGNQPAYGCASGGSACRSGCPYAANAYCSGGACGCSPTTCASHGWNCDPIYNGCGDVVSCGTCSGYQTCGGGGVAHVCGCTPQTCGTSCGSQPNGCGGWMYCGDCPPPPLCPKCVLP